ncbi:MAG: ArsR/SmtB family transcription factor [Candidatus Hodarchaeota archaeon]
MKEKEFFSLVGNATRREILRSIAREPKYLFQLSQELNRSQQSLQRHLDCLLEKGWIVKRIVEGERGPARKLYHIAKNLSVRITLSQHSFDFDVFEIIGKENVQDTLELDHVDMLGKDLTTSLSRALNDKDFNPTEQTDAIQKLDVLLDEIGSIENLLLSQKLFLTGNIIKEISMRLDGDAHRQDREVAYTLFSTSAPITIDLFQKEIKTKRSELLASLKRLNNKNLLPEHGINLMKKLESTLNIKSE